MTIALIICAAARKARTRRKTSKVFFFKKKKQKAFMSLSRLYPERRDSRTKSFWVPFFKKGLLALSCLLFRTMEVGPMDEFRTMPGHLIRRLHQSSVALFAQQCAGLDLTPVQYAALAAVGAHPGVDATRLAVLIAFDRCQISLKRGVEKLWSSKRPRA